MWPNLQNQDAKLVLPWKSFSSQAPKVVVFDVGNVLIDLNWDEFLIEIENWHSENRASHSQNENLEREKGFQEALKVTWTSILKQENVKSCFKSWSTGKLGPSEFVKEFSKCLGYQFEKDALNTLLVKKISSTIVGSVRPGIVGFLRELRSKGIILAVLSNAVPWHETDIRRTLCLEELFDVVLFSQDFGYEKPEREFYAAAQAEVEKIFNLRNLARVSPLERKDVYFIDDLPDNVRAGTAFGWNCSLMLLLAEPFRNRFLQGNITDSELSKLCLDSNFLLGGAKAFIELKKLFEGI